MSDVCGIIGATNDSGEFSMTSRALPQPESYEADVTRPGLVRAIGALNLVVGLFLFLFGLAALYECGPFLRENHPFRLDPELSQRVVVEMRADLVRSLRERSQTTRDVAEKKRLAVAIDEVTAASTDLSGRVNFSKINAELPWISRYLALNLVSGPPLNLLLALAGVGLWACRNWGRRLAIGLAVLKLGRLLALAGMLVFAVVPALRDTMGEFAATDFGRVFAAQATSASPMAVSGVQLKADEIVRLCTTIGYGYAALALAFSAIYPAILLIVLTRPARRRVRSFRQ